jgi:hypothetical protein
MTILFVGYMFAPLIISPMPVTLIRSTMLLCQLEITKDLAAAERIRASIRDREKHFNKRTPIYKNNDTASATGSLGSLMLQHQQQQQQQQQQQPIRASTNVNESRSVSSSSPRWRFAFDSFVFSLFQVER